MGMASTSLITAGTYFKTERMYLSCCVSLRASPLLSTLGTCSRNEREASIPMIYDSYDICVCCGHQMDICEFRFTSARRISYLRGNYWQCRPSSLRGTRVPTQGTEECSPRIRSESRAGLPVCLTDTSCMRIHHSEDNTEDDC